METIITTNRKLVPQRGCRRVILRAFSTVRGELSLVAADGLMLRAVIGEDAAHVLHAGHEEHVSKEDHDAQQALEQVAHDLIRGDKAVQERAEQRRQHEEQRDGERQSEHDGEP